VVVVGAGPSSLFFANLYLRSHPEATVRIIERSCTPLPLLSSTTATTTLPTSPSPAFGFGLGQRARRTLGAVPGLLAKVKGIAVPLDGPSGLWMVNRAELCGALLEDLLESCVDAEASQETSSGDKGHHPLAAASPQGRESSGQRTIVASPRLALTFGTKATAIDRAARTVVLEAVAGGSTETVAYSLLVGADGVSSNVRAQLEAAGAVTTQQFERNCRWKALALPPQPQLRPGAFVGVKPESGRREYGGVLPRFGGGHVALLFWPTMKHKATSPNPFDAASPEELRDRLTAATGGQVTAFPCDEDLKAWLGLRAGRELFVKVSAFHDAEAKVALLGDSAAGMYSILGQGCACGLQGAASLDEALSTHKVDVTAGLEAYSAASVPEGHAATDLNTIAHLFYSRLGKALFGKRCAAVMQRVNDPTPYAEILRENLLVVRLAKLWWRRDRRPVGAGRGGL